MRKTEAVLLFDGYCRLCSRLVQFVLHKDRGGRIKMASIQSAAAQRLLAEAGHRGHLPDSMIFIKNGRVWFESEAALHLAAELGGVWSWFWIFRFMPRFLTDGMYRCFARNRYRIWGKTLVCYLPDADWKERFLDAEAGEADR